MEDPMSDDHMLGADSLIRWRVRRVGPQAWDGEVTLPLDLESALRSIARPAGGGGGGGSGGATRQGAQRGGGPAPTVVPGSPRGGRPQPVPSGGGTVTARRRGRRGFGSVLKRALGTALRAAGSINPIAGAASSLLRGVLQGDEAVLGAAEVVYPPELVRQLRRLAADLKREK
jgi:hypothetical protein